MNEKLEQAKNEIVKEYGYESFESFDDNSTFGYDHRTPEIINKVAVRYHELMNADIQEQINQAYELGCRTTADDILNSI